MKRGARPREIIRLSDGKRYYSAEEAADENYYTPRQIREKAKKGKMFTLGNQSPRQAYGKHRVFAERFAQAIDGVGGLSGFCEKADMQMGHVSGKYSSGRSIPMGATLIRIAHVTGVSIDWPLGLSDVRERR
jgi:hypothetical protein